MRAFAPDIENLHETEQAIFQRLAALLGQDLRSDFDVANLVEVDVAPGVIERLTSEGLSQHDLEFVIPPKRLSHRIKNGQALTMVESERSLRVARLLLLVEDMFGSKAEAIGWLRKPIRQFGGKSPLEMAHTEPGGHLVEQLIAQSSEGYFA